MTYRNALSLGLLSGLAILAATLIPTESFAQSRQQSQGTLQQRMDCADDARMVCGRFIPDVARITQCMQANKRQLTPQCRRHFR